jgi:hypothetical protein
MSDKVAVENVNVPGHVTNVDAAKYHAMKDALLAVLPAEEPGMVVKDAKAALLPKSAGWICSQKARPPAGG